MLYFPKFPSLGITLIIQGLESKPLPSNLRRKKFPECLASTAWSAAKRRGRCCSSVPPVLTSSSVRRCSPSSVSNAIAFSMIQIWVHQLTLNLILRRRVRVIGLLVLPVPTCTTSQSASQTGWCNFKVHELIVQKK